MNAVADPVPAGVAGEPGAGTAPRRAIRSYVLRQGRTSPAQSRAVETLLPRFGIAYQPAALDFPAVFGRDAPTVLEIGFGMGETTARIAQALPDTGFLGVEVHTPEWAHCCGRSTKRPRERAHRPSTTRSKSLRHMIAPDSLAGVHVFFPTRGTRSGITSGG
jgi:tRNA (guanine-N7-)-methyltransferase